MGNDWIDVSLADVSDRIGDGLHGTPTYCEHGAYPFINGNNLENGSIVVKDATKRVSQDEYLKHKKELTNNTVLVSINGTIGNVALYDGEEVILGKSACYINLKDGISKHFIKYVMSGYLFQEYIQRCSTGSTIKNVSLKMIRDFRFKIPKTKAEQLEVIQSVKYLDNKITLNRQINRTLEQMAQALFKSWFVDFDPVVDNALDAGFFAEHRDLPEALLRRAEQRKIVRQRPDFTPLPAETRQLFPAAFEACEEPSLGLGGWVPQGWKLGHLSDIAGYGSKRVDVLNLTVDNYISTENMLPDRKGVQPASNLPTLNSVPAYTTRYVLVSNIRPYFKKIWLASGDGGYSNDVLGFESKNAGDEHFLFNLLYQDVFFDFMMATSKGSKMPRGDKKTILSWGLVIPPLLLRKLFSTNVSHFYESMTHRNNECNTLSQLRDTLLPKLIAGELRLNDNAPAVGTDNND